MYYLLNIFPVLSSAECDRAFEMFGDLTDASHLWSHLWSDVMEGGLHQCYVDVIDNSINKIGLILIGKTRSLLIVMVGLIRKAWILVINATDQKVEQMWWSGCLSFKTYTNQSRSFTDSHHCLITHCRPSSHICINSSFIIFSFSIKMQ